MASLIYAVSDGKKSAKSDVESFLRPKFPTFLYIDSQGVCGGAAKVSELLRMSEKSSVWKIGR